MSHQDDYRATPTYPLMSYPTKSQTSVNCDSSVLERRIFLQTSAISNSTLLERRHLLNTSTRSYETDDARPYETDDSCPSSLHHTHSIATDHISANSDVRCPTNIVQSSTAQSTCCHLYQSLTHENVLSRRFICEAIADLQVTPSGGRVDIKNSGSEVIF